jgi:hypothetical protein
VLLTRSVPTSLASPPQLQNTNCGHIRCSWLAIKSLTRSFSFGNMKYLYIFRHRRPCSCTLIPPVNNQEMGLINPFMANQGHTSHRGICICTTTNTEINCDRLQVISCTERQLMIFVMLAAPLLLQIYQMFRIMIIWTWEESCRNEYHIGSGIKLPLLKCGKLVIGNK